MVPFRRKPLFALLGGACLSLSAAHAQVAPLDSVVVTAERDDAPLTITTDPRKPRQPLPAHDGADFLKPIPGFSVIRKGGDGGDQHGAVELVQVDALFFIADDGVEAAGERAELLGLHLFAELWVLVVELELLVLRDRREAALLGHLGHHALAIEYSALRVQATCEPRRGNTIGVRLQ